MRMTEKKSPKPTGTYSPEEIKILKNVNYRLELLVDYKHQFKSGLLRGIGFAIGASIIGAIIVTLILSLFDNINNPFVQDIINNAESSTGTKPVQNE
jgi:hypothetical protein